MKGRTEVLSLYRSLLRAHAKHLPPEMRQLGDAYVKSEFRAHKEVTKPAQLSLFFNEWQRYLDQVLSTARAREAMSIENSQQDTISSPRKNGRYDFGQDMSPDVELSEDQLAQLERLREEASKAGK